MNEVILSNEKKELMIVGKINFQNVVFLRKKGEELIRTLTSVPALKIDLSQVEKSDISGLSLLMSWLRLCKHLNIPVQISHLSESLLKMSEVCGIKKLLVDNFSR